VADFNAHRRAPPQLTTLATDESNHRLRNRRSVRLQIERGVYFALALQ